MKKTFPLLAIVFAAGIFAGCCAPEKTDLQKRADAGDVSAQYALAEQYARGFQKPDGSSIMDAGIAAKWYAAAGAQGHAEAKYKLGLYYWNGLVPARTGDRAADAAEGIRLIRESAAAGNADAAAWLAEQSAAGNAQAHEALRQFHPNQNPK